MTTPDDHSASGEIDHDPDDPLGFKKPNEAAMRKVEREMDDAQERQERGHATRAPRATGRTTPIAVRFDEFTIKRLRALAERRNIGYQTLLKQFVVERIYEEEKRDRVID